MNKWQYKSIFVFLILVLGLTLVVLPAWAQSGSSGGSGSPGGSQKPEIVSLENPLGIATGGFDPTDPASLLAKITRSLILYVGAIAFLFFVLGGFYWIFSGGNEERVKKGKEIMTWTIVGVVIVFTSYAILRFVLAALQG
jgi:hypothetical protein